MKHPFNATALAAALVSLGFACGAHAQSTPAAQGGAPAHAQAAAGNAGTLSADDRNFVQKAAEGGMAEVEAGKLAQQKAQDPQVKAFGERMVQDHSKANERLQQVASAAGVDVPKHLDKKAEQEVDKLSKLSGGKFDQAYMKDQVSDHQSVIKEFQKEAKSGSNAQIRQFAQDTLPTLEEHLKLAKADKGLQASQKATGATYATAEKQQHMPVAKTGM